MSLLCLNSPIVCLYVSVFSMNIWAGRTVFLSLLMWCQLPNYLHMAWKVCSWCKKKALDFNCQVVYVLDEWLKKSKPDPLVCVDVFGCVPSPSVCPRMFGFSHPCELGAHFFRLLYHASLQHVLGTLGVDKSVSCVQSLGLIHPLSSLLDVPSMLWGDKGH